jgi:hypothetical protein
MLEFGKLAQDKVTKFQGIITAYCKHLTDCDMYKLTPTVDRDGKINDTHWFEEARVTIIGEGIYPEETDRCEGAAKKIETLLELGKYARDKVTGFEGTVTAGCVHLYNCNSYVLKPRVKKGLMGESHWVDEAMVEIIGEGIKYEEVSAEKKGAGDMPKSQGKLPRES